jgi:hypothetical protein
LGNPPFVGARWMSKDQKQDIITVFENISGVGDLDYVAAWYYKTIKYINGTNIQACFVATNSLSQGQHPALLWKPMIQKYNANIHFAYRTFVWSNEARGKAAVHCVIIGFSSQENYKRKQIFDENGFVSSVTNINPYLADAPTVFIERRTKPICNVPDMIFGSMPNDGGHLLIEKDDYTDFIKKEPSVIKYIKKFMMGEEFINNLERWCLWLIDIEPAEFKKSPLVLDRVSKCKNYRLSSSRDATKKGADFPYRFMEVRQPNTDYIAFPKVSSERRNYIPIGYLSKNVIAGDKLFTIPHASLYYFGILTSDMHMTWMRTVGGRLKSDYSYSNTIIYNNFPFPNPTDKQKVKIEQLAQAVLDARSQFPKSSLADLYDPLTMPTALLKAHQKLDKSVETAYGRTFDNDSQRVAFLFEQYQKLTGDLFVEEKKKDKNQKVKTKRQTSVYQPVYASGGTSPPPGFPFG